MEELKVKKDVILDAYRAGTEAQKDMLEKLYGKEIFYDFEWKEVEEKHNQEWETLCSMIYNDENLLCNFWYEDGMDEEINYYI